MFDVGFTELLLIGLVALLVLGPTKMLDLARITGRWAGRLRRQFNEVKDDIDRELKLDEMRRKLAEEERALRDNLDVKMPDMNPLAADAFSIDPMQGHPKQEHPKKDEAMTTDAVVADLAKTASVTDTIVTEPKGTAT